MSGISDCLPKVIVMNKVEVSNKELGMQVVKEISSDGCINIQEGEVESNLDSVSILSLTGKRKHSEGEEIELNCTSSEVSKSPKRACMTSYTEKVAHDHTYCIKSPRRLKKNVYNLVDKIEGLQKKVKTFKQKTRRRNKKVSTLASVVSELKEKNLINTDCAALLETTFSGVLRELMKRLAMQKKKKNPGVYPLELR